MSAATKPVCVVTTTSCPHKPAPTYSWSHNPAAFVGILLCVFLILLWRASNSGRLKRVMDDHYSKYER